MPNSDTPVRMILAGLGAFGREHFGRLVGRDDLKLVGVADTNPDALERIRSRHDAIACFGDPSRLIDEVEADAIIVATPAPSHVEICLRALARNLCVLLEKPVAPSTTTANALLAAARSSAGFVLPGHVLRFSKDHARLVDIVRSGRIGEVRCVNSRRYRDDNHALRYPDDDPVLMTLIHDIDLANWVTGSDFRSVLARRSEGSGFRSLTTACATTMTGVLCDLRTAWTFPEGELPPDQLEVVGDRGSVELAVGRITSVYSEGGRLDYPPIEADDPLRNEHDHFLSCIVDRSRTPALGLAQALAGLKLADAALEVLRLNREVVVSV